MQYSSRGIRSLPQCAVCFVLLLVLATPWALSVPGSGRSVAGKVEDSEGKPVHEAVVELLPIGQSVAVASQVTDHQGNFQFREAPPESFQLAVFKAGFEPVVVGVPETDRIVRVVLASTVPSLATELSVYGATPRTAASASELRAEAFNNRVIEDPGDALRVVPGLTVVQHAGGGKANQYLIRGFDADHGTDFAISLDGVPVNLVSHAHGQGYADLNFLIPETLESIEVYKGPYFAELGNLDTAGSALLRVKEEFGHSFFKVEGGQFDTGRALLGWTPKVTWTKGFVALESAYTNGPFQHGQDFRRLNLATRWTFELPDTQTVSVLATAYSGRWNQSGQIPLREVEAGRLNRFEAIDPSEGGKSSRINLSASYQKIWTDQAFDAQFYIVHYDLDLFSNFTFNLSDRVRGDGIEQTDNRKILGSHVRYHRHHNWLAGRSALFTAGFDYRQDFANVGLLHQRERARIGTVVDSRINELNCAVFVEEELEFSSRIKLIAGLRYDRFRFDVVDRHSEAGRLLEGVQERGVASPKVSLLLSPWKRDGAQFYINYGRGFHSNDSRSVVADPSGVALATADGYEIGYRQAFGKTLEIGAAYWLLDLSGELVFVGDEGTTELSGPTRRYGPEVEVKWRLNDYLWLDADASYTRGRFLGTGDAIPRAPRFVSSGGVSFNTTGPLSGNLRLRHVGNHPLVEDGSVLAKGYTVADLFLRYSLGDYWSLQASVENLFNAKVLEAQTYFESQLPGEPSAIGDNHFSPGNPFTLKLGLNWRF